MSLHIIIKSDHRKKENVVSRCLHEIREIAKAGLRRLALFRTGLTARSTRLLAMRGDAMSQVKKLAHARHAWVGKSLSTYVAKLILSNETSNTDVSSFSEPAAHHGGGQSRWWRRHRGARAATLIAAAVIFSVFVAQSKDLDDVICVPAAEGEVPEGQEEVVGCIAEEIPEEQANADMADVSATESAGETNTPDPKHANQFAFEGPDPNNTFKVAGTNINQGNFQDNDDIDVPTGAAPSPLFNAQPFTQQMLRFEEFGPVPLGPEASVVAGSSLPAPANAVSVPDEQALDDFLDQYITPAQALPAPFPTRLANDPDNGGTDENPWKTEIEAFLGRDLVTPPSEGRPPGEDWAHQRWLEFFPQVFVNTATAGARTNLGLRDKLQFHQYSIGEFAPGGLYHNTAGVPATKGTTSGIPLQFHPDFPVQDPLALWTWDGTFPPKLLMARYGESVLFRHYNALPIDPAANLGFGLHTTTTHEHNGHNPAESDGYTQAFFFPGQFYDYHWVMVVAGFDTFSLNLQAGTPTGGPRADAGSDPGITPLRGDWREIMSTHWFHDHMLDFTAPNVYKGSAAMFNMYSAVDRGNEAIDDGVNLRFPSGTALNWGNRDYDVNLIIADKAWDADGQLFFNIFNLDGFIGDQILTNWLWNPYLDVRARRYRFRILNGSVARYFRIALVELVNGTSGELSGPPGSGISYNRVPFHMIANDGNIMEHSVFFDGKTTIAEFTNRKGILPTQAIAERYDIIVNFAQFAPGTKLYMVNLLEHHNGRRPHEEISLQDVLNGEYHGRTEEPADQPGPGTDTDPGVARFLEFRVQEYGGVDLSMDPADFVAGKKKMIPLPGFTQAELDDAIHRTFKFARSSGTDTAPWTIKTDGGSGFTMDPRRLSASPTKAKVEIWHIEGNGGWSHPVHVHFEEGQILKRGGEDPPEWEKWARKDIFRIGRMDDSTHDVEFAIRFREFLGTFMEHCHNTQHEDHAMLLRWDVENPGQVRVMPTPMPTWDGVGYVPSYALPTFRDGDLDAAEDSASAQVTVTVNPAPLPVNIDGFTATPTSITDGDSTILAWTTSNATGVAIDNGVNPPSLNGNIAVSPASTTTYTLTAQGTGGPVSAQVTVTVNPAPLPVSIDSFTATPTPITAKDSTTLAWTTSNATSVAIDNEVGSQEVDGSIAVSPASTTTYTLTAQGTGGPVLAQVTVTVNPASLYEVLVSKAVYRTKRRKWRFKGTTTAPPSSRIDIYFGSDTLGKSLGSAKVKADQTWAKTVKNSPLAPDDETTTVTVVPRDGGAARTVTVKVKS